MQPVWIYASSQTSTLRKHMKRGQRASFQPYYSFWRKVAAVKLDVIAFPKSRGTKLLKSDSFCRDVERFNLMQRSIAQLKNFQFRIFGLVVIWILYVIAPSKTQFVNVNDRNPSLHQIKYWWELWAFLVQFCKKDHFAKKAILQKKTPFSWPQMQLLWQRYRSTGFLHWLTFTFETAYNPPNAKPVRY